MNFGRNTEIRKTVRLLQKKKAPFSSDKPRRSGLFPKFPRYFPVLKTTLYQPFSFFCKPYPTKIGLVLLSTAYLGVTVWRGMAPKDLDKPLGPAYEDAEGFEARQ
jgi:hypothetical protein